MICASTQVKQRTEKRRKKRWQTIKWWNNLLISILRMILIIAISYVILLPILTKISSSFMTKDDLVDKTVYW
ncbi:MAG: hypothetical protein GX892_16515, partial [Thermoanaerobacteraceae bacterium]|nr:hypothetical protein [Thermoanaerobacteraceae bacterium]